MYGKRAFRAGIGPVIGSLALKRAASLHFKDDSGRLAGLEDKRVLVVEEEAMVAMLVEGQLAEAGARVLGPAFSVGEALRLLEAATADGGVDAAVLDIKLCGKHVAPVADKLAALGVPFLFITGCGEGCDTGGHGTAPTLRKPFGLETFLSAVQALLPSWHVTPTLRNPMEIGHRPAARKEAIRPPGPAA